MVGLSLIPKQGHQFGLQVHASVQPCNADNTIDYETCPVTYRMSIVGREWKTIIRYLISLDIDRLGKIQRSCARISKQMLTNQLRELENDGVLKRKTFAETPPRVEYSFPEKGLSLLPVIESMKTWGSETGPAGRPVLDSQLPQSRPLLGLPCQEGAQVLVLFKRQKQLLSHLSG